METLLARYQSDGADFLDGIPKTVLPDLDYLGDFGGSAVYGFFVAPRFFLVNAPGGPGLVEFVNGRLRQLHREVACPTDVLLTACGTEETAGLPELVAKCHPQVFAAPGGIDRLRDSLPAGTVVLPASDLAGKGWFPVELIAVGGRGQAPVAYRITWAGKTVLFSGRIPSKINQESGGRLIADLTGPAGDLRTYFESVTRLFAVKPDLWLPAVPVERPERQPLPGRVAVRDRGEPQGHQGHHLEPEETMTSSLDRYPVQTEAPRLLKTHRNVTGLKKRKPIADSEANGPILAA